MELQRFLTEPGVDPFDAIAWEARDAVIGDPKKPAFQQLGVEFPADWTQGSVNITAQKYFRGKLGTTDREFSVKQIVERVAKTITTWGYERGYFKDSESGAGVFYDELRHILVNQLAAFNSPVWFNVGFEDNPQCSACFILSVADDMESILQWNTNEGIIFRGGSGSGINLSRIRGSMEQLSKGGYASGPVSFMRGADAWAGTIRSGGKTRRAAKMVVLDIDHPDILDFIWAKAREEQKAAALRDAGFDLSIEGDGFAAVQYQNANNSVRISDEFMERVEHDEHWTTYERVSGSAVMDYGARELFRQLAQATWQAGDPGVQFDTTINNMHTCPNSGRINASNPCSEYMHVDNSACNLASLNLLKFRKDDGTFDIEKCQHVVDVMTTAMDILVGTDEQPASSYPTEEIAKNAHAFRQLGLGYANLGALLMSYGLPYDSDHGRNMAEAITALVNARAYRQSAELAKTMGSYERFTENDLAHMDVMDKHLQHAMNMIKTELAEPVMEAAIQAYEQAIEMALRTGFRNAQATVIAPTGTIAFLMGCDTTGIEPDFALVKHKELVGGGFMKTVNQTVGLALQSLGYTPTQVVEITDHLEDEGSLVFAPHLKEEHVPVFATAVGNDELFVIDWQGHVDMMSVVQRHVSGAISKTVNLPAEATVEDVEQAYIRAWKGGVKAVAIYRDGSKTAQALRVQKKADPSIVDAVESTTPQRRRMPRERKSITHKFSIAGHEGYITAGMYEDGTLGEVFMNDMGKEGSTLRGMMNAFATSISISLQYGVPLELLARKFSYMRFDPEGFTGNQEIPVAKSIPDYVMRWLASRFLDVEIQHELGIKTPAVEQLEAERAAILNDDDEAMETGEGILIRNTAEFQKLMGTDQPSHSTGLELGPACSQCGAIMQRTGTCHTCPSCGNNTGCG